MELFDELGADIRDEELIRWYGTEANFYFVPQRLCLPIIQTLLEKTIETEPEIVVNRIEDLLVKHNDHGTMAQVMDYSLLVARLYQKAISLGSLTLNTPDEYVMRYQEDYYVIDQLYRQNYISRLIHLVKFSQPFNKPRVNLTRITPSSVTA